MLERWFITNTTVAVGPDLPRCFRIDVPDPYAVEGPCDPAPDPVADAEVEVGVERRDDLAP